jgi:hypothetical protein
VLCSAPASAYALFLHYHPCIGRYIRAYELVWSEVWMVSHVIFPTLTGVWRSFDGRLTGFVCCLFVAISRLLPVFSRSYMSHPQQCLTAANTSRFVCLFVCLSVCWLVCWLDHLPAPLAFASDPCRSGARGLFNAAWPLDRR